MKLKTKRIYNTITPEMAEAVLEYFYTHNDNRSTVIAKALGIKVHLVDYILDIDLSYKKNYMGTPINKQKTIYRNCKRISAYDLDNKLVGVYNSLKECSKDINVSFNTISKHLNGKSKFNEIGYTFQYENANL